MNWIRKIRVAFGEPDAQGFQINRDDDATHDLYVSFTIDTSLSSKQNPCKLKIRNLSESHRNRVGNELKQIQVEAGYVGGSTPMIGILFSGQIRDVEHQRRGADIITSIKAGDGDAAYRFGVASQTFQPGRSVRDVIEYLYQQLTPHGVSRGQWQLPANLPILKRPYSVWGSVFRELDLLGRSHKFYWSIQHGKLEIIPGDGFLNYEVTVSKTTGMIGIPTLTDTGCKVRALINPAIQANRLIRVDSENFKINAYDQLFRISKVKYVGENRGNQFYCDVTGESLKDAERVETGVL